MVELVNNGGFCEELLKMVESVNNGELWEILKREEAGLFGCCSGITGVLLGFVGL